MSSSRRPGTKVERSAATSSTSQAGDEAGEIVGVGADVAERSRRGRCAPGRCASRLLLAGVLKRRGEPVLRIFDLDHAELAELAGGDHLARLPDHRIAGVVVGQAEDSPVRSDRLARGQRVVERGGERLVADDVDAGFEEGLSRRDGADGSA